MRGSVLLVGDELLGGVIADRNLQAIARLLLPYGVVVRWAETVGDDVNEIAHAVERLAQRSEILVVTGGLGPTEDDLTREAIARALGVGLREDAAIRARLEEWRRVRGLPPSSLPSRQAQLPEGTSAVDNPVGSAPGIRARLAECEVWVLPGVPHEASAMIDGIVRSVPGLPDGHAAEAIVATAGLSEVAAAERLRAAGLQVPPGIRLGFLPGPAGVRLRIAAPGGAPKAELDACELRIRRALGWRALPAPTLQESLVRTLEKRGATIVTAESCTGGLVGARITDVAGASSVYLGGIVAYSNAVKVEKLGVSPALLDRHGAVSEPVAVAMAEGARAAFGSHAAVSITGIAGPGGGTAEKPIGTVCIALADPAGSLAREFRFPGDREMVRERSVNKALEMAYRRVREAEA